MRLFNFGGHPILVRLLNKPFLLTRSNDFLRSMKHTMEYFALCIFPAADRLKKSYQMLIGLNEIYTVFPDIRILQAVIVERV